MSFGLNCSGIELKTLIILSPLSLGFYCSQMNPFTVTAADEKKLMAAPVRWERGMAKQGGGWGRESQNTQARSNVVLHAQLGDNYIPGHYKLKTLLMRQIHVWWILEFLCSPPPHSPRADVAFSSLFSFILPLQGSFKTLVTDATK